MTLDDLTDELEWRLTTLEPGGAIAVAEDGSVTVCKELPCPPTSVLIFEVSDRVPRPAIKERIRRMVLAGALRLER